ARPIAALIERQTPRALHRASPIGQLAHENVALGSSIEEYESLAIGSQFRIAEVAPDPIRKTSRNALGPPGLFVEPLFPEVGVVLVGSRLLHGVNQPSS